jgi:hypothetical protein
MKRASTRRTTALLLVLAVAVAALWLSQAMSQLGPPPFSLIVDGDDLSGHFDLAAMDGLSRLTLALGLVGLCLLLVVLLPLGLLALLGLLGLLLAGVVIAALGLPLLAVAGVLGVLLSPLLGVLLLLLLPIWLLLRCLK